MPPIGETLREARMRRKLDIADVEEATKIRAKYLRALENEEWSLLPGPTFVKTFLRTYAELVGVDPMLLVDEYRASHEPLSEQDIAPVGPMPQGRRRDPRRDPRRGRRPPRTPPSPPLLLGLVAAGFVAFILILGATGDEPPNDRAGTAETATTETTAAPAPKPPRRAPKPVPKGVSVRIAPAAPTYACLDKGAGTDVVFEGTLEAARTFRDAKLLRVNLGKRAVDLRLNGKRVEIPASGDPVGYELRPGGATEITDGRPCA